MIRKARLYSFIPNSSQLFILRLPYPPAPGGVRLKRILLFKFEHILLYFSNFMFVVYDIGNDNIVIGRV